MTKRSIRFTALGVAIGVHLALLVGYGAITQWCFCSVTGSPNPPIPPPSVMRFLVFVGSPSEMVAGAPFLLAVMWNLAAWFLGAWVLLEAMVLAARVRIGGDARPRIRLARRSGVRRRDMLLIGSLLMAAGLAYGGWQHHRWIGRAERVFAATMSAAAAGRPLPREVEFSMYELRNDGEYWPANPDGPFVAEVDASRSGWTFPDRFVAPLAYGGVLRFASGKQYEFGVYPARTGDGWSIDVSPLREGRRRRWSDTDPERD